jgi:hypothetical protein
LPFRQPTSQVLFHALELGGDKLLKVYRRAFVDLIDEILNDFYPAYEAYTNSDMIKEP